MSWGETKKINNNMKRALNEQLQDQKCLPMRVITATGTYTPEKTGLYKVICVGAGAKGTTATNASSIMVVKAGSGGGVAIKNIRLESTSTYNVTVSTTASFGNIMSATGASSSSSDPIPGTATGGDYNFDGEKGLSGTGKNTYLRGASVGVHITELSRSYVMMTSSNLILTSGECLLAYGGGGLAAYDINNTTHTSLGFPAAIIIIPLEMEE